MDDKEMSTPIITSLVVVNEPYPHPSRFPPPWRAPFLELLHLLRIIDNSQRNPKVDDQRLCFQPSHDLSEISRIFVSVSTPDLQYDVDLETIRAVGSNVVPQAAIKLQEYANNALRRIQQFRDYLLERHVTMDATCFTRVGMFTCPVCLYRLIPCLECDAKVACSNAACLAAHVVDCEQCFAHNRVVCYECLKKNDTVPPLICCPTCKTWCCREDMYWCAGLVVQPTLGSRELADLSRRCEWDNEIIVRSHPPKPSSCRFCSDHEVAPDWATCYNSINDMEPDRCPSQTPFMTDHRLRAAYCPDCLERRPGCRCACGVTWLCDMCLAVGNKTIVYPYLITCPRCGVSYCTGPDPLCGDYIELCRGCKGVILCNDCQEQEELPGAVQTEQELPKQVVFTEECSFCKAWSCGDCCASERSGRCFHCGVWYCHRCVTDTECDLLRPCLLCGDLVCRDCRMIQQSCTGNLMLWAVLPPQLNNFQGL